MKRISWSKVMFISFFVITAALCQTIFPLFPVVVWEGLTENIYPYFLKAKEPIANDSSQVVVIRVDSETRNQFGWPIARKHYVNLLKRLEESGHPWVVSTFRFQDLSKRYQKKSIDYKRTKIEDDLWQDSVKEYGKYIGTSLVFDENFDTNEYQEEILLPRVVITGNVPNDLALGDLDVVFDESDEFVNVQKKFGFGLYLQSKKIVYCIPPYIGHPILDVAIPTAMLWGIAYHKGSHLSFSRGMHWVNDEFPSSQKLPSQQVAEKHCFSNTNLTTHEFFQERNIMEYELSDFLHSSDIDLTDKIVLLATTDGRKFRGPGKVEDSIAYEYQLMARFIDGMITGDSFRRDSLNDNNLFSWIPVILAMILIFASIFLKIQYLLILNFIFGLVLSVFSYRQLIVNYQLSLPIQSLLFVSIVFVGLLVIYLFLKAYGIRRVYQYAKQLRNGFGQCNSLQEISDVACKVSMGFFEGFQFKLSHYNEKLHKAAFNSDTALNFQTEDLTSSDAAQMKWESHSKINQSGTRKLKKGSWGSRSLAGQIIVKKEQQRLGKVDIDLLFRPHEEMYVYEFLSALQEELEIHWARIELLMQQRIQEFHLLAEKSKNSIISKFLAQNLVSRFNNAKTMDQNLIDVLEPRVTKVALLQADIRDFSKLAHIYSAMDLVKRLQSYYANVVNQAQEVAQVKLIGDCIFLFIEQELGTSEYSPSDIALNIASLLVRETDALNRHASDHPDVKFGVAIHYGEVVVGNLSSENCIDYTVMGNEVNKVARLEAVTKEPQLNQLIGVNGLLVSDDARENLNYYQSEPLVQIDLNKLNIKVRSFPEIESVWYVNKEQLLSLKVITLP